MIASLFGPDVLAFTAAPEIVDDDLPAEEWEHVRKAGPKRRAEFGTARRLARRGLAALGFPAQALAPTANGAPAWPRGVVGSITHTDGFCAVVVAPNPPIDSLGLDAEVVRSLDDAVVGMVLTPAERRWVAVAAGSHTLSRAALPVLFFSAKEAYYKCQYPLSRTFLDFHEVEISFDLDAGRFEARALRGDLPPPVMRLGGRFLTADGRVICGIELSRSSGPAGRPRASGRR